MMINIGNHRGARSWTFFGLLDFDVAVELYDEVSKVDPYNLDNMDTYSNILYVKVMMWWL
jgi:hypothetical protein